MAVVFALPRLFDRVVTRFAAEGTVVPMAFGWLAPSEQAPETSRIVWTPGDDGGSLGQVVPPKYVGENPRQLLTLNELCTLEIYAFDPVQSTIERAQYQAARELFDSLVRAIFLEAHGTFSINSAKWVGGDRVRRSGATLKVVLALQAPILDEPIPTAPVDTGAHLDVTELDHTESIDVPAPVGA
jgi:hypothetical protein